MPTAPIRRSIFFAKDAPGWLDVEILDDDQNDVKALTDIRFAQEMTDHFHKVLDEEIVILQDSTRFIIGGFSLGGFLSSCIWKTYPKKLGGVILYAASTVRNIPSEPVQEDCPVFWVHGTEDPVIKYKVAMYCNNVLDTKKRAYIHLRREELGHGIDKETEIEMRIFFRNILLRPKL